MSPVVNYYSLVTGKQTHFIKSIIWGVQKLQHNLQHTCIVSSIVYISLTDSTTQPNRLSQGTALNIQIIPILGFAVKIVTVQND